MDFGDATLTIASVGFGLLLILLLVTVVWAVHKWKVLMIEMVVMSQMILYDTHQASNSLVQENLVGVEEGRRSSMAHPLLCGIMMALLVLGIGLAAWALVGIDRRSQQLARSECQCLSSST